MGVVALIIGFLIGNGIGSQQANFCVYGIPNTTNSSALDGVDAFQVIMVNASYQEVNATPIFCNASSLTAQQSAFVVNAFKTRAGAARH